MRKWFKNLFKKEFIALFLIVLIALFLRLPTVLSNSFAYTYDVGRDLLALANLLSTHKPLLIGFTTGLPGVFYGPWWYYILLPFYVVVGGNPQGIDLLMVMFGVISVILGFYLGRKIEGNFLGIAVASLMAVSNNFVFLSTQIWNPNIAPMFILIVLFIFYRIFKLKAQLLDFWILGLLLALIIDLEIIFGSLLFIAIVFTLILTLKNRINFKSVLFFLLGIIIVFSPRIIFEIRHQFIMTNSLYKFIVTPEITKKINIFNLIIDRFNDIFIQFNSTFTTGNYFLGLCLLIFIIVIIVLFYKKASIIYKNYIKLCLTVILTFFICLILFKHDIWPHYLVGLPVIFILLFALSLGLFLKITKNYLIVYTILLIVILINLNPIEIINSFNKPMWVGNASVYRNQLEIVDYVYSQTKGKDFKYVVYTPPVHDYTYQYLFKWYGFKKYNYLSSNNSHLAFFILEPDEQYPFRLSDWLKQREKDGKIINSKKFRSGIIVQTRVN